MVKKKVQNFKRKRFADQAPPHGERPRRLPREGFGVPRALGLNAELGSGLIKLSWAAKSVSYLPRGG
jgi:hypothetical protein